MSGICGNKKIAEELRKSTKMEKASRDTVAKAMKEMGLKAGFCGCVRPTTTVADPSKNRVDHLLNESYGLLL